MTARVIKKKGAYTLPQLRKILITLPETLLREVDNLVLNQKTSRSELVREAMRLYIRERKRIELRERMKKGYQEMAEINKDFADMCFEADSKILLSYEEKLAECE